MQCDLPPRVSVKIEELPDADEHLNRTQNLSKNDFLVHHMNESIPDDFNSRFRPPNRPPKKLPPEETILARIKAASPSVFKMNVILQSWVPKPRWNEIDDGLLKDLTSLDSEYATSILSELKQPRHIISKINHKSVEIPLSCQTLDDL